MRFNFIATMNSFKMNGIKLGHKRALTIPGKKMHVLEGQNIAQNDANLIRRMMTNWSDVLIFQGAVEIVCNGLNAATPEEDNAGHQFLLTPDIEFPCFPGFPLKFYAQCVRSPGFLRFISTTLTSPASPMLYLDRCQIPELNFCASS